jgi:glycosyltransferase involved in cell wall biosynthesis
MHILFLTHYFPPEVNAPASRTYENAKRWVKEGHEVTVITCVPNHPKGIIYPGYKNAVYQWEEKDGIRVLRVITYLTANEGFVKRTINYVSYMISATVFSAFARNVDLVVSTSPQFFCGMAGLLVSGIKRKPWVLEIRDLWPESIISVGAIKQKSIIGLLEWLEKLLYKQADHIISVTQSFKKHILAKGGTEGRLSVITNGADLDMYLPLPKENPVSHELGLDGRFVVSYIGTHGMAHALGTVLKAAKLLENEKDVLFLLVGDGAEREKLLAEKEGLGLSNVLMLPQQPKEKIPHLLAASDANMVLLRNDPLFKTVIPSKIFEAMAMERPIILGVDGESRAIIENGKCGIPIEPENHVELAETVMRLYRDRNCCRELGQCGRAYVMQNYSRQRLSEVYLGTLKRVVNKA